MSTKQNPCRHVFFFFGVIYLSSHIFSKLLFCRQFCWQSTLWAVIFSQNCCFVSKALVDDSNMCTCMQIIIFQHHPLIFCWLLLFLFIIQWASLNILHVTLFFKSNYHFVWTFTHQQEWLARYIRVQVYSMTHPFSYLLLVNDFSCLSLSEHHINTFCTFYIVFQKQLSFRLNIYVWAFTYEQELPRCAVYSTTHPSSYLLLVNSFSCLSFNEHHYTFYILHCFSKAIIISSGHLRMKKNDYVQVYLCRRILRHTHFLISCWLILFLVYHSMSIITHSTFYIVLQKQLSFHLDIYVWKRMITYTCAGVFYDTPIFLSPVG